MVYFKHAVDAPISMQEACSLCNTIFWSSQRDGQKSLTRGQEVVDFFGKDYPLSLV